MSQETHKFSQTYQMHWMHWLSTSDCSLKARDSARGYLVQNQYPKRDRNRDFSLISWGICWFLKIPYPKKFWWKPWRHTLHYNELGLHKTAVKSKILLHTGTQRSPTILAGGVLMAWKCYGHAISTSVWLGQLQIWQFVFSPPWGMYHPL
jgi:hypothetical protein